MTGPRTGECYHAREHVMISQNGDKLGLMLAAVSRKVQPNHSRIHHNNDFTNQWIQIFQEAGQEQMI